MRSARDAARLICALGAALLVLAACRGEAAAPQYHESANPEALSQWGQLSIEHGRLLPGPGVLPYDLNTALFSDYAVKLRTIWLPDGAQPAAYDAQDSFDFPVGTVITKTFYYPRAGEGDGESFDTVARTREPLIHFEQGGLDLSRVRLIETRILVRREAGWDALPYVWDEDQREAHLSRSGAFVDLTLVDAGGTREPLSYMVPNVNQCANCHETDTGDGGIRPIGPAARHLNRDFDYAQGPANQLAEWRARGLLAGGTEAGEAPANTAWSGAMPLQAMLEPAARSYLDINCAHCHSRTGPADTSGLYLERAEPSGPNLGFCKPPIAAGRGTGGRRYSIIPGDAHASILVHRMESDRADIMMPELGRSIADREGVALVAAWIDSLAGSCEDA